MPSHIMLSYQWDDQALVKKVFDQLRDDGFPVWMDIEGGVTGDIHDAIAAGVEEAVVICPFMTQSYQESRSCKKELTYAESREVTIVPVMLANDWEASEWLGLITAGLLWLDFRNLINEEHFELCVRSLEEEILFNAGDLLTLEEQSCEEPYHPESPMRCLRKKVGRAFRHAESKLYIHESDEQSLELDSGCRKTVELKEEPGIHCSWQEVKGKDCKYYRNVISNRYLGFDPFENQVYSDDICSLSEEWLLLMDQMDQSHLRAVIIRHKHSGMFLAVQDGIFIGLTSYNEDCKWFLE